MKNGNVVVTSEEVVGVRGKLEWVLTASDEENVAVIVYLKISFEREIMVDFLEGLFILLAVCNSLEHLDA